MILSCNFEEIRALASGAELLLSDYASSADGTVAAPAAALARAEQLPARIETGSLSIETLAGLRAVREAVSLIGENLHDRLESKVVELHPAHEEAVSLYFDYAHVIGVLKRLDEMGAEMAGMIELMTGEPPTAQSAAAITFPD